MIILILMVMSLQIILPMHVYADNDFGEIQFTLRGVLEEEELERASSQDWYIFVHRMPLAQGLGGGVGSNKYYTSYKEASFYEEIYYITEVNGVEKIEHPSVKTDANGIAMVSLSKDIVYYRPAESRADANGSNVSKWKKYDAQYIAEGDDIVGEDLAEKIKNIVKEALKAMVSRFIYSIANGLHYLVGSALGEAVTIDDIVFNNYKETNISYFDTYDEVGKDNASSLIYGEGKVGGLNSVVNKWYAIFMKISILGYMAILVYMGIRIMLTSTADEKAGYKNFFMHWIIGIAILFLFPYAMKYMINTNESFVETIEESKGYETPATSPLLNQDFHDRFTTITIDDEIDWSKGDDYMSVIAYNAKTLQEPALSIAFLVMTWQLIVLVFHYYKRLFMIAFLIIIFPLVVLSYAIDKIADGKSQAFNTWAKEYILNVFVQTFHAVVYVFVCSTVYSASGINESTGYDFILVIVGVTFLFKGEEILRKIFGQVSAAGTMGSLKDSAAATFAKFTLATNIVKGVGEYTVGKKSVPRKVAKGVNELRAINARMKAFDKTSTTPDDYNIGMRLEHAPKVPKEDATEEAKKDFLKERSYFNAAAVLNNPNSHSQQEKARALKMLKDLSTENPNHNVFKDTKMTVGQIAALANLDNDVEHMISSGMRRLDIEREINVRMGIVFSGETEEAKKDNMDTYMTAMYLNGSNTSVSRELIRKEIDGVIKESKEIRNNIAFGTNKNKLDEVETEAARDAYKMYERYRDSVSDADREIIKGFALNLARLNKSSSGAYDEKELLDIANYIREHEDDNEFTRAMINQEFGVDIDMFMHSLAKKVEKESDSEEAIKIAKEEIENYETNSREGYFDDEVSVHEVLKDEGDKDEIDRMIEELYQNKHEAMKEATEDFAKQYLVDNGIDIMKDSYDTDVRTQDGYTEAELLAMKVSSIGQTLSDLAAVNKEKGSQGSDGLLGWVMKEILAKKEEERTGISRSMAEMKDVNNPIVTTQDFIEKNKTERDRIQNEHFLGDIGDRK